MSKRKASDEAALEAPSRKRINVNGASPQSPEDVDGDGDDYATTSQTPGSVTDVESPMTAATTPRAKFPSDLKTLPCTWPGCPKTFNRPARLRDHMNSHTNSRPFKCSYDGCDKDYIEDKHLKQHVKAAHTNERKYACQVAGCSKSFVTGTRLKRHQLVHEGADRFRCPDCRQSFRKRETLTKHVRKQHLHVRAYACSEQDCTESFDSKPALKRHHDKIHGDVKFWCFECGLQQAADGTEQRVGFTTELLLQDHLKREHQNCLFCDFKSTSRWELDQHVDMHHSGKTVKDRKIHACTHQGCDKKFTKKSNLTAHVRSAHEGFRFICGQVVLAGPDFAEWSNNDGCGDKFSTKVRLEDHVRFIHLGHERPKLSSRPGPRVPAASSLIDDLSGVTNQVKQTILCPECPEGFVRYHDLEVHLRKAHQKPRDVDPVHPRASRFHNTSTGETADQPSPALDFCSEPCFLGSIERADALAAQTEYYQSDHGHAWPLEEEANLLLLAGAGDFSRGAELNIDPSLVGF